MTKILLLGFDNPLREDLTRVLTDLRCTVCFQSFHPNWSAQTDAHVVFCSGDSPHFRSVLREIGRTHADLPVVLVTRLPEVALWLDALEAGATDYCAAPFEPTQLRWILESVLPRPKAVAA